MTTVLTSFLLCWHSRARSCSQRAKERRLPKYVTGCASWRWLCQNVYIVQSLRFSFISFLAIFSRALRDSTPRFVRPSVGRSVCRSVKLYFFYDFYFLSIQLLPKWSSDLKYGPCPPARDWGSRVSGLVCFVCLVV